jgi:hypothetical protein
VAATVATAALPDASAVRAGASAARATSSIDRPAAGASAPAPGACSSAASAALSVGGAGFHLSGGPAPRHAPLLPPILTTSSPESPGGQKSVLLAQPILLVPLFPMLLPPDPPLLLACRLLLHPSLRRARSRLSSGRGWVGMCGVHGHPLLKTTVKTALIRCKGMRREGGPTHRQGVGEHNERPEVVVAVPDGLEANGTPRPRGRIFLREVLRKEPRVCQRRRVGRLAHLMNAELPLHDGDDC